MAKRRLIGFLLAVTLAFSGVPAVYGAEILSARERETKVFLDGSELYFTLNEPLVSVVFSGGEGAKMYVPLRVVLERYFGYEVVWDGEKDVVDIFSPQKPEPEDNTVTTIERIDAYIGYVNIPIAEFEEYGNTKWNIITYEPDDLDIKSKLFESEGKTVRSFTLDIGRLTKAGRRIVTFEQTQDGKPTGERKVYEINVIESQPTGCG